MKCHPNGAGTLRPSPKQRKKKFAFLRKGKKSSESGSESMSADQLLVLAKENPFWEFKISELAILTNRSEWFLGQMSKASDSPIFSGKSRPERIRQWLELHPGWRPSKN